MLLIAKKTYFIPAFGENHAYVQILRLLTTRLYKGIEI